MEVEGNNNNNTTTTTTSNINHNSSTYNMESNVDLYPSLIMIPPFASHHNHNHNHNHNQNNHNDNNNKVCCSSSTSAVTLAAAYDHHQQHHVMDVMDHHHHHNQVQHLSNNININNNVGSFTSAGNLKAKIMAHPHYPRLLSAYVSCQKVGAPPEVVARLEEAQAMAMGRGGSNGGAMAGYVGEDPALDQFMEAYCEMLTKYEQELTKPFKEAMIFLSRIECQFKALTLSSPSDSPSSAYGKFPDRNGSSEEDIDVNNNFIDPSAEDRELKGQLLRKYSGYLGSLRQEFLKKRKKGKLPKEARQQLLDWWSRHYKWPYPSESQKLALAESTGLDQKQINNWFINQRKRHWKPSEDMQFVVMDAASHSHAHHYAYMDNVLGNPFPMDISSTLM